MFIDVNLDEVSEGLKEEWYLVRIKDAEQKKSAKGNDGVLWDIEIQESEDGSTEFKGWTVGHWTGLGATSLRFLKKFLRIVGFEWEPSGFDPKDVIGHEFWAYIVPGEEEDDFDNISKMKSA